MIDSGPDRWSLGTSHSRSPTDVTTMKKMWPLNMYDTSLGSRVWTSQPNAVSYKDTDVATQGHGQT